MPGRDSDDLLLADGVLNRRGKEDQVRGAVDVAKAGAVTMGDIAVTLEANPGVPIGLIGAIDVNVKSDFAVSVNISGGREGEGDDTSTTADGGVGHYTNGGNACQRASVGKVPGRCNLGDGGCKSDHDVIGQPTGSIVVHGDDDRVGAAFVQDPW